MKQTEALVTLAQNGDNEAMERLLKHFRPLALTVSRDYRLPGSDADDAFQEAMIGLYKAVKNYRASEREDSTFRPFATMCIRRHLITALKTSLRLKHESLNKATSMDKRLFEDDDSCRTLADIIPDRHAVNVLDKLQTDELAQKVRDAILGAGLSAREATVLRHYMAGMNYKHIALTMRCSTRSVDNTLQRVRKKTDCTLKALLAYS